MVIDLKIFMILSLYKNHDVFVLSQLEHNHKEDIGENWYFRNFCTLSNG